MTPPIERAPVSQEPSRCKLTILILPPFQTKVAESEQQKNINFLTTLIEGYPFSSESRCPISAAHVIISS